MSPAWRVRVGDYRVIYEVHDRQLRVIVITVEHRREAFRRGLSKRACCAIGPTAECCP